MMNIVMLVEIRRETLIKAKRIALRSGKWFRLNPIAVSYTHLTLPTTERV